MTDMRLKRRNPPAGFYTIGNILNHICDYENYDERWSNVKEHQRISISKTQDIGFEINKNENDIIEILPDKEILSTICAQYKFLRIDNVEFNTLKRHFRELIIFLHCNDIVYLSDKLEEWYKSSTSSFSLETQKEHGRRLAQSERELILICNSIVNISHQRFIEFYPDSQKKDGFLATENSHSPYLLDIHNLIRSSVTEPKIVFEPIIEKLKNTEQPNFLLQELNVLIQKINTEIDNIRANWIYKTIQHLQNEKLVGWAYGSNGQRGYYIYKNLWQSDYALNYKGEIILQPSTIAKPRMCLHISYEVFEPEGIKEEKVKKFKATLKLHYSEDKIATPFGNYCCLISICNKVHGIGVDKLIELYSNFLIKNEDCGWDKPKSSRGAPKKNNSRNCYHEGNNEIKCLKLKCK